MIFQNMQQQFSTEVMFQQYVRTMDNQVFLSENQLNALYAMVLLNRSSLWESVLPSQEHVKQKIDTILENKIAETELVLGGILKSYEEKIKNSQLNWLQKFMGILKAKIKNIYIQKVYHDCHCEHSHEPQENKKPFDTDLLSIFYGISNINALTGMGIGKFTQYNATERYITFKMGDKYNLTIKNQDPIFLDETSVLSVIPKEIFTHHILSYFNANQLFNLRAVCKEWTDYVRQSWQYTFKREMLSQLLASQFCKQIQFNYILLKLRNPFYQKLSLLLHALIDIINWDSISEAINDNSVSLPLKRVIIVLMKLLGQQIPISVFNQITDQLWDTYKQKAINLRVMVSQFFSNLGTTILTVQQLKSIKKNFLDHPFMRVQEMNPVSDDKTPLLLSIFIKQFTLQSILKNHILLTQQYLLNSKRRLDLLSRQWPVNKGFLETAYKILLLKNNRYDHGQDKQESTNSTPDFASLLKSIFEGTVDQEKPDFVIKNRGSVTNVYLDRMTKLDILITTFKQTGGLEELRQHREDKMEEQKVETEKIKEQQQIKQTKEEEKKS